MRIVFIGAIEFSRCCLNEILKSGGEVVGIFTIAKELAHRHSDYADLLEIGDNYGIPTYSVKNINAPHNIQLLRSLEADVIFIFGWSQLVSEYILKLAPLGCIGTHPALLPRNRGRHPIIWALVEGLEESGLTFLYLDEGTDSGDILWQKSFPITLEDNAASLYKKIEVLACEAIREFLIQLEQGTAPRIAQDHSKATYWRKRTEKDGEIDWLASSMKTYNQIRALARPYVGAHTHLGSEKLLVWRAGLPDRILPHQDLELQPGIVLALTNKGFDVRTGDGYLTVLEYGSSVETAIDIGVRLGDQP